MTELGKQNTRKIKVLIVDDSASVRQALSDIIASDPELEVLATASDPYVAAERIRGAVPDVIFLDIEMPRMDGLTFLRKIMAQRPVPVVICSSLTDAGSEALMQALEGGAVDVVTKPRLGSVEFLKDSRMRICDTAKAAAHAKLRRPRPKPIAVEAKLTADAVIPLSKVRRSVPSTGHRIVCIGASTGGTEALRDVLEALPSSCPPIVIVQHMPERFTNAFARRLDTLCAMSIKEAEEGDEVVPGRVLIAPGNRHMLLKRSGKRILTTMSDGPPVCRHRPSVDVLFRSAAQVAGPNAVGVIMTGMGDDGAQGLLEMRNAGALTVAQDEESCVVFGMPKEAIERGAAQKVVPLSKIAHEILLADHPTATANAS